MDNFDQKPLDSIRGIVQDKLSMILFNKNDRAKYKLVGSSAYRLNKYYGDLDILEEIIDGDTRTLVRNVIKNLRRVVSNIKKKRSNYLTDFKVGIDNRYAVPIIISKKSSSNGVVIKNAGNVAYNVESLTQKKLIPSDISKQILNILSVPDAVTITDYYFMKNYFRKASTIRWTYNEIMSGIKKLPQGGSISLEDAIKQQTLIKLDYVTTLGDRFIEVTNFLVLGVVKGNEVISFNMPEETLLHELRLDIDKFLFTDYLYDPFKAVKRMFNVSRILWKNDQDTDQVEEYMDKLIAKLLKSDVSFLSKLKSGLAPMSLLIEKGYAIPKVTFKKHLDLISFDIPNCSLLTTSDIDTINNMLDKIYAALSTKGTSKTVKNKVMNLIDKLDDYMQKNINYFTASYIRNKGYGERRSLALFLPKNSVSTGIIDEVPFQKDDIDFIVQTGNGNYPTEIIEMPQNTNLVIPVKNTNIAPTFESLSNDLESFDILGEKHEEESSIGLLADYNSNEKSVIDFNPSTIVTSDLIEEELLPGEIDLLTDKDISDLLPLLENITNDYYKTGENNMEPNTGITDITNPETGEIERRTGIFMKDKIKKIKYTDGVPMTFTKYNDLPEIYPDGYYIDNRTGEVVLFISGIGHPDFDTEQELLDYWDEKIREEKWALARIQAERERELERELARQKKLQLALVSVPKYKLTKDTEKFIKNYYDNLSKRVKSDYLGTSNSLIRYDEPSMYELTPKIHYPSYIEEPDDYILSATNYNMRYIDDSGPTVEEIDTYPFDISLLEEFLGPMDEFASSEEYLTQMFIMILHIYPDYVKNVIGNRKFKSKTAKEKYLFRKIMEPIVIEIMNRY